MKYKLLIITSFLIIAVCQTTRADNSWYISGSIGGYFRESDSVSETFYKTGNTSIAASGTNQRSFDPGLVTNAALGYEIAPQLRLEAEIGYIDYSGSVLNPNASNPSFPRLNGSSFTRQSGGDWSRYTGTINAFYDLPKIWFFTPYLGGGGGISINNTTSGLYIGPDDTPLHSAGGSDTGGLGLLEVGYSISLIDNLSMVGAYRYIRFFSSNEDSAHIVKVGLRYTF